MYLLSKSGAVQVALTLWGGAWVASALNILTSIAHRWLVPPSRAAKPRCVPMSDLFSPEVILRIVAVSESDGRIRITLVAPRGSNSEQRSGSACVTWFPGRSESSRSIPLHDPREPPQRLACVRLLLDKMEATMRLKIQVSSVLPRLSNSMSPFAPALLENERPDPLAICTAVRHECMARRIADRRLPGRQPAEDVSRASIVTKYRYLQWPRVAVTSSKAA